MTNLNITLPEAFSELRKPWRIKVFYGGRGGAKSWAFALTLLIMGMENKLRILCARELQISISDSVHKLLADLIGTYSLEYFYTVTQTSIKGANGTEFMFKGLKHNATEIKSTEGIDIAWVEEAEKVSDASWELLIPTIRKETKMADGTIRKSEIWVSFNPKHPNDPTYKRFILNRRDDAYVRKVSWRDNPFFPDVLNKERLHLKETDPEAHDHIWEGEFDTRFFGGIYSKQMANIEKLGQLSDRVEYDPNFPVYTSWDLGFDDATAIIFFQIGNGEIFIIDAYENNGHGVKHYLEVLAGRTIVIEETNEDGEHLKWHYGDIIPEHAHRKDWYYETHYVPHDAMNKVMAAGGRSIVQQAWSLGVKMYCVPRTSVMNGIEAARGTIVRCWINKTRCKDLVDALFNYCFEYDDDKQVFKSKPKHDWSSHFADAFEQMARMWREKALTMKEINSKKAVDNFHRLRRIHKVDKIAPYRIKPVRKSK